MCPLSSTAVPTQEIIESINIRDLLQYIKAETTAVLVDLDNTFVESQTALGSDQWFKTLEKVTPHAIPIYTSVQKFVKLNPMEPIGIFLIKALQDIGVPVLAITARNDELTATTLRQLKALGIDFGRYNQHLYIEPTEWKATKSATNEITLIEINADESKQIRATNSGARVVKYENWIIFCSGVPKGDCLTPFLEIFNERHEEAIQERAKHLKLKKLKDHAPIQHFIMIDDGKHHLESVKTTTSSAHFHGLWYRRAEPKVKALDFELTYQQLSDILHLLPDTLQEIIQSLGVRLPKEDEEKVYQFHFYQEEARLEPAKDYSQFFERRHKPRSRMLSENDKDELNRIYDLT